MNLCRLFQAGLSKDEVVKTLKIPKFSDCPVFKKIIKKSEKVSNIRIKQGSKFAAVSRKHSLKIVHEKKMCSIVNINEHRITVNRK